ncbi:hypothetical protein P3X46_003416 [Hevea brasiliensis]|uniref:Myosin motor domain-containing protein n=1 Tax=Hevea brasiliensis TaxID=3981 RepID=A0ABQ9N8E8_HEVBR|nr:hypothetical protein P3X46_003416 [Hevea brasiliensis]
MQVLVLRLGLTGTEPKSNPVLEAFGNAETVRNNNSRAAIRTYLLKRSRVCQISDPERNHHCFYLLCAAPQEEIEKYKLGNPRSFHYPNQSTSYELVGVNDAHDYLVTRRAMDIVGINEEEQFCINLTNEKLQQHFNQHVFKMVQQEYIKEEIDWSYIDFVDNQDILDLIEKKTGGIIALLDEACMFPKSTHETFAENLQRSQTKTKTVVPEHQDLLSSSKCSFVSGLFHSFSEETAKPSKFSSIGLRFKQQLQQLMDTLNSTEPHYIRCVKPNNTLEPAIFDSINVMQQLRSGGVLEAIRIKCSGYPTHMTFSEVLHRFGMLAPEIWRGNYEEKVACKWIFEKMELTGYQLGNTKVFLRTGQMAELDAHRRHVNTRFTRKNYILKRQASIHIQSRWRGKQTRQLYKEMTQEAAAVKIQRNLCRQLARRSYNEIKSSAVVLQTGLHSMAARSEFRFKEQNKAATAVQAYWRSHRAVSCYKNLKESSVVSQCSWRERTAEGHAMLLKMKIHLWKKNDKLEKQVEELTSHLQSEKQLRIELEVAKGREITTLLHSLKNLQNQVDETNAVLLKERKDAYKENGALLWAEKQRADNSERKYAGAQELSEKRRKILKETERRVRQIQGSLNRMFCSIPDQFTDLKMILHTSSNSTSTSRCIASDVRVDVASDNSDALASDSDFSFPAPVLSPASDDLSSPNDVKDLSTTEISGSEKRHGDKEEAFDDYF